MLNAASSTEVVRSRTSDIYDRIRDDITRGRFAPGLKLKIEVLRSIYGIGATPIREALSLLTADGLVERLDQRGFRVAEVSAAEFDELLALRCWIEERAVSEAIRNGGKDWEEGIVIAQFHLSRTPRVPPDVSQAANLEYERCHRKFHSSLVAACGSNTLLRLWNQLYNEANRYRYMARLSAHERPDIGGEHEEIAAAVLGRDTHLAVQRLVAHYRRTGDLLRHILPDAVGPELGIATLKSGTDAASA
jgi:DNA-binding GntR family transcriptional regulator